MGITHIIFNYGRILSYGDIIYFYSVLLLQKIYNYIHMQG